MTIFLTFHQGACLEATPKVYDHFLIQMVRREGNDEISLMCIRWLSIHVELYCISSSFLTTFDHKIQLVCHFALRLQIYQRYLHQCTPKNFPMNQEFSNRHCSRIRLLAFESFFQIVIQTKFFIL